MLHITDISKSFGTQVVFDAASLHVKPSMRVGLVGANGAGKTTLLRLIAGEMSLDEGEINARKGLRIGFLPQEIEEIADHAVLDEVLASYADILNAEHRMAELGEQLAQAYATTNSASQTANYKGADNTTNTAYTTSTNDTTKAVYSATDGATQNIRGVIGSGGQTASATAVNMVANNTKTDGASSRVTPTNVTSLNSALNPEALLKELGALQASFESAHGYELEARAQTILRGMGFKEEDFQRPIADLSGGWRMRVALSRLLLEQPDLLLLDEPTNHLDLDSLIWLENFLLEWTGSLIVISHDRYFLNKVVTHIVDLERGGLDLYAGNYDHFEKEKLGRYEALINAAKNQQREIDSAESFVRRFRAKNTKAKQVQQKIRQLEKMERIDAPTLERKAIKFRFPQPPRCGRVVAELKHVRKVYGDNVVYKKLDLVIERGEKIALVGHNGAGKSTLLKLLAGVIQPDGGTLTLGHNVQREYFAQHQLEVLNPDHTVLKTMENAAGPVGRMAEVRSYLGTFLFGEDDVTKKIMVLSGGEKARLALALMLIDPAGLLLLDEPTNHLDMVSREVLTEALRQYEGSAVFISHDRHLINAIGSKVIEVSAGRLQHYPGNWEYYLWKKEQETIAPGSNASTVKTAGVSGAASSTAIKGVTSTKDAISNPSLSSIAASANAKAGLGSLTTEKSSASTSATASKDKNKAEVGVRPCITVELGYKERKEYQSRYRKVEKRILAAEQRQTEVAEILSDPANASNYEILATASSEATALAAEISELYEEWAKLAETLGTTVR